MEFFLSLISFFSFPLPRGGAGIMCLSLFNSLTFSFLFGVAIGLGADGFLAFGVCFFGVYEGVDMIFCASPWGKNGVWI